MVRPVFCDFGFEDTEFGRGSRFCARLSTLIDIRLEDIGVRRGSHCRVDLSRIIMGSGSGSVVLTAGLVRISICSVAEVGGSLVSACRMLFENVVRL
jgi:hypothetical protein